MTPEEIRAAAIERVARAKRAHELVVIGNTRDTKPLLQWDELSADRQEMYRQDVSVLVDALGDMLPTSVETSMSYDLAHVNGDGRIRRFVCPWERVPE